MSVIVLKDGIIAADKQTSYGDLSYKSTKLRKHTKDNEIYIIGGVGNVFSILQVEEWFLNDGDKETYPKFDENTSDVEVIVIKQGDCFIYENCATPIKLEVDKFVWGSGNHAAAGALYMGATAIEAVEAACEICSSCGKGVDWFNISDTKTS